MSEHADWHYVRITDNELGFIEDFDPDRIDGPIHPEKRIAELRRWVNTVKDIVEEGLESD